MRTWTTVAGLLCALVAELGAVPEDAKKPLGAEALGLLRDHHKFCLAVWKEVLGQPALKYAPIKEKERKNYLGEWEARWHEPIAEEQVGMKLLLKADGTWVSRGVGLDEDGDRFDAMGHWYLHHGAIQLWDGPVSEDREGGGFLFVQNGEFYMMFMQSRDGRVKLTRAAGKR